MTYVFTLPVQVQAIAAILLVLFLAFVGMFLFPALIFRFKIARRLSLLEKMRKTNDRDPIVPLACATDGNRQKSLLGLAGSGKGLWGKDSSRTLHRLREEWRR